MSRDDINYSAIDQLRQGVTGDALFRFYSNGARKASESYMRGDSDAEKIARLEFQIGMLTNDLRRVCDMLAEAVEPPKQEGGNRED